MVFIAACRHVILYTLDNFNSIDIDEEDAKGHKKSIEAWQTVVFVGGKAKE